MKAWSSFASHLAAFRHLWPDTGGLSIPGVFGIFEYDFNSFKLFRDNIGRVNGRRARQERRKPAKEKEKEGAAPTAIPSNPTIILAKTENVVSQPVERTTEVKVS